jgi:PBP1b-binding outer membrane lipoprotein LpoB
MKKALSISMLIVFILMLPACSSNTSSPNKSNKNKDVVLEKMTATEVEQM